MSDENRNLLVRKANALLHPIETEAEYDEAVRVLSELLDAGGADEEHELAPVVDALGDFVGDYDDARRADEVRDES
jgi:hypothetical protein